MYDNLFLRLPVELDDAWNDCKEISAFSGRTIPSKILTLRLAKHRAKICQVARLPDAPRSELVAAARVIRSRAETEGQRAPLRVFESLTSLQVNEVPVGETPSAASGCQISR